MNERIRELAEQAGAEIKTLTDGTEYRSLYQEDGTGFDLEKFAELIVRECVNICIEHPSRIASNNWHPTMVSADIAYRLEEHFGVEE